MTTGETIALVESECREDIGAAVDFLAALTTVITEMGIDWPERAARFKRIADRIESANRDLNAELQIRQCTHGA